MDVIISTKNNHKLVEISEILEGAPINLLSLSDFKGLQDVIEDGKTFEENAAKKAVETAKTLNKWTLGDDSGLVIDALGGAPGILSARYAENSEARIVRVLREMRDVPEAERTARFVCAVALSDPHGDFMLVKGICEGSILFSPRGGGGFGYDPIFLVQGSDKSMAELSMIEKNSISHRGKALSYIKPILLNLSKYQPEKLAELKKISGLI